MEKKFGAAVWGAGWVAGEHVKAYLNNAHCEVVAIGSRKAESAKAKAKEACIECSIYTNYDELLKDPRVDIVTICTPNHLHAMETIKAAEAGKHILIEKPVALNVEDLVKMRDAVRKAGVKTVVSFVLRWNPLFECIKGIQKTPALGRIFYAEVDYWHPLGRWYKGYDWVTTKESGGSMLLSAGCHAVDAIRYFVESEVAEVTAYSNNFGECCEYDANIVAILKFENGVIGKVSASWDIQSPYNFNIDLLGTHGTLRDNRLYSKVLWPGQTKFAEIPTILPDSGDVTHHPFQPEIDHLVNCILTDTESPVNLEDAVKTHEVCIAADISAEEGHPVRLPLIRE
jgi:predicted dehydrogenase